MTKRRKLGVGVALVCSALLIPLTGSSGVASEQASAPERGVYTVTGLESVAERTELAGYGVDVVSADHALMTIVASPSEAARLRAAGFDLSTAADAKEVLAERSGNPKGHASAGDFPEDDADYHSYDEMTAAVKQAAADHGDIVALGSIGQSYEGRDLPLVKISDNADADEDEPEVLFTCNMHAREHLTTEMCLHIINRFTDGYADDENVKSLVDTAEIWIVPQVNPDGITYDIETGEYQGWRKTRQPNDGSDAIGTDPNRNWDYKWGCCGGSSENPSADDYRGPSPFSEPETRQIAEWVESRVVGGEQQIKGHIDFHTFSELVLWPYGYTTDDTGEGMTEEEAKRFGDLGTRMAETNGYTPEQASDLYVTDGSIDDWMWGKHKVLSFTFEMYPSGGGIDGFYPPDEVIAEETARNDDAIDILLREVGAGG